MHLIDVPVRLYDAEQQDEAVSLDNTVDVGNARIVLTYTSNLSKSS